MFELPADAMFFPFSSGSVIDCESKKSLPQAMFGQNAGWLFGTWQNFEYIVACGTSVSCTLNPSCLICCTNVSAVSLAGEALSPTASSCGPLYLPLV